MILINLLPHREAARKRRRDLFNITLGASALAGALVAGAIFLWYQAAISEQQGINLALQTEIKKLEGRILLVWRPKLPHYVRVSRPWRICSRIEICQCICGPNLSISCPMVCIYPEWFKLTSL